MISCDECFSKEVADYLNSHPAFTTETRGSIMNPYFFELHIKEFTDTHRGTVPIADKYRKGVWGQEPFSMEDAKEFLRWLDPMWMDFKHLTKSEFFETESDLTLANDGIEFMDI